MRYIVFFLFFLLSGCMLFIVGVGSETYIDYTFWSMRNEKKISDMNCRIIPKTKGYYRKTDDRGSYPNIFYLTADGYFIFSGPTRIANETIEEITSIHRKWGRFVVEGDSLEIQYFEDTNLMRVNNRILRRYDLAVRIGKGIVVNDKTLTIYKDIAWCSVGCDSVGSYTDIYDPPLIYSFTPSDTLPPNDNWIKHLDYSKNKLE